MTASSSTSKTSLDDLRGRSSLPPRGNITYSALRLRVPSEERSIHISPDRITRHASPGRKSLADEQEVVPRIPQPYRTSFSAVTSPRRVPRPSNFTPLSRSGPLRSTMPCRVTSPGTGPLTSPGRPTNASFSSYDHSRASKHSLDSSAILTGERSVRNTASKTSKLTSRSAENVLNDSTGGEKKMTVVGFSNPELSINRSLVNGDRSVKEFMAVSNGTLLTQTDSDTISNTLESTDFTDGGTSPEPQYTTFEVETKKLITREYVHVKDISYFKALEKIEKLPHPDEETEALVQSMMKGKKRDWRMLSPKKERGKYAGLSLPTSPDESPKIREQRSGTLPSETLLSKKPMASTPVKRSLSTSITNFFKRMSPKSVRRSSKASQKSRGSATPDSSNNSLQAGFTDSADELSFDSDQSGSGKNKKRSPRHSPIRNFLGQSFRKSKSKEGISSSASTSNEAIPTKETTKTPTSGSNTNDDVNTMSPTRAQAMSDESTRILKSIENNSQTEKSVYQAFKEKQSPKRVSEAIGMKPQALKAVEFPDEVLNVPSLSAQTSIDEVDNANPLVPSLDTGLDKFSLAPKEDLPKVTSLPGTLDSESKKKETAATGLLMPHKLGHSGRRANDPPKTLDVREVAKLQKNVFMFPNMSAESIGQCSVNLYTSGSEPSLVSRNSQRSVTTASKRTLVSQDTSTPHKNHPQSPSEVSPRSGSQPTLLDDSMPATTDSSFDSSIDTTPKTPSYMKISCALSGYNRYYTSPKQEAKLKIIKLSEQNSSHSSLSSSQSDSSEVRTNGDLKPRAKADVEENGVEPLKRTSEQLMNGGSSIRHNGAENGEHHHQQQTVIVNGGTEKLSHPENDVGHRYVTMATVNLQPSGSPPTTPEVRNLQWEEKLRPDLKSAVSTPSPSKDGHYYFPVLDREVARIKVLCELSTQDLENNSIPEEVSGKMRAAIGKSNLLINKKFQQFRGLCDQNINQSQDDQFTTTVADLAGFWDMVSIQISDIDTMFRDIENMRQSGWKIIKEKSPVKQTASKSIKSTRSKDASSTPSKTAKSAKAEEAARARDEARKRLLAAKRAGRQRKASQSDKDEIEIFVAE